MAGVVWFFVVFIALIAFSFWISFRVLGIKRVIVYEYQKGLRYDKGRYIGTVGPGQYWVLSRSDSLVAVDGRTEFISILGQDVLSADGVPLKVSLAAEFQVENPNLAVNKNVNFRSSLYLTLQMALREITSGEKIEALLENRSGIGGRLMELASPKASAMGLKLISADIKDIMFPGEMKKAFAQVVKAQKEGQAALERARGETAALRSLANAAKMMEDNPNLLQLRALQALADSSGNTLVLGLPNSAVPIAGKSPNSSLRPKGKEEPS
ncbi:MAG TPA: slipin family protein [Terriglobia bacterium]|nr:slipin family protein [Terriglobia bacterium]